MTQVYEMLEKLQTAEASAEPEAAGRSPPSPQENSYVSTGSAQSRGSPWQPPTQNAERPQRGANQPVESDESVCGLSAALHSWRLAPSSCTQGAPLASPAGGVAPASSPQQWKDRPWAAPRRRRRRQNPRRLSSTPPARRWCTSWRCTRTGCWTACSSCRPALSQAWAWSARTGGGPKRATNFRADGSPGQSSSSPEGKVLMVASSHGPPWPCSGETRRCPPLFYGCGTGWARGPERAGRARGCRQRFGPRRAGPGSPACRQPRPRRSP